MSAVIKNIIFDWGGVIKRIDYIFCVSNFSKLSGKSITEVSSLFNSEPLFKDFEKGVVSESEFICKVKSLLGTEMMDSDIISAWNSILRETPEYKLLALLELKKKYRVFLLSNTNSLHAAVGESQFHVNGKMIMRDFFDAIFYSHILRVAKPDRAIFLMVAEIAGIIPSETLFVDDSEANCEAAAKCGFRVYNAMADSDWRTPLSEYFGFEFR